jgi:hypothetical protein
VWASSDDVGGDAFAGPLDSADFGPTNPHERDFDAPTPWVFVLAFTLPTQVKEAACRWPVGERAAENGRACFVPSDIESEIEIACLTRLDKTWVNPASRVLHSEAHRFV